MIQHRKLKAVAIPGCSLQVYFSFNTQLSFISTMLNSTKKNEEVIKLKDLRQFEYRNSFL